MIKNFDIKIGYECNNNCRHCVVSDNYKFGNVCDYQITAQEIIDKLKITKAKYITITGGEPTIRKDL
ncbi:MAG: radical SAM protein, partial [bacterium]